MNRSIEQPNARIYHVGLLSLETKRGRVAILQYRRTVDELDCEILQYLGTVSTTKKEVRAIMTGTVKTAILGYLNKEHPRKRFVDIAIQ